MNIINTKHYKLFSDGTVQSSRLIDLQAKPKKQNDCATPTMLIITCTTRWGWASFIETGDEIKRDNIQNC